MFRLIANDVDGLQELMMENAKLLEEALLSTHVGLRGTSELDHILSNSFGNSQKYDLIMDYKGKLYKVQVKHANEHEDTHFDFKTRWQSHNSTGYTQTSYTKHNL